MSRRRFLQLTGTLAITPLFLTNSSARAGMWSQLFGSTKRTTSPITPNEEFYITSYRTPPYVPADRWALSIRGTIRSPFTLTYPDLLAQPASTEIVTLECVGNGVAGEAIGTAEWHGVRLKSLLDKAGVTSQTQNAVFHAADGYSDSLTIERAMRDDIMVAYRMNGVPLPLGHGFPARMIVPGHYGMKHVQWLTGIELVSTDYRGYYQRQDWSDEAIVKTKSWIMNPQTGDTLPARKPFTMQGFAFAGSRGIHRVDISTDGGESWSAATLAPPLSPYSWVMWNYSWEPQQRGDHRILARATDGTGTQQSAQEHPPFPDGASGLQEVIVAII
ncbi:MAG: molybdopterin-dependent oxidoreductase [Nitrospira sp.]|nr:molybdopterin-dependent oxidoreductase [Nitrospira sp.]